MNRPDVGSLIDRKKRMDSLRQNLPMGRKKTIHRATAFPETTPRTEIELHLNGGTTVAFNLEDPAQLEVLLKGETRTIKVPGSNRSLVYDPLQRVGVRMSRLGTSAAVAIGAYAFALQKLGPQ